MVLVYLICIFAVVGLSVAVGYLLAVDHERARSETRPAPTPQPPPSDKEVDARVDGAVPLDDDLDWLREWSGPPGPK